MINEDSLLFLYEFGAQAGLREIPFFVFFFSCRVNVNNNTVPTEARFAAAQNDKKQRHAGEIQSQSLILSPQPEGKILFFGGKCAWWWWGGAGLQPHTEP